MLASSFALSTNPTTLSHVQLLLALFLFVLDSLNLHLPSVNTWPCSTLVTFLSTLSFLRHFILKLCVCKIFDLFMTTHEFSEPPHRNQRQRNHADSLLIAWLESDSYTVTASYIAWRRRPSDDDTTTQNGGESVADEASQGTGSGRTCSLRLFSGLPNTNLEHRTHGNPYLNPREAYMHRLRRFISSRKPMT